MIDTLFFDVDDTLLDFGACERNALQNALQKNGYPFHESMYQWYHTFNLSLWKQFERGEIDRDAVLHSRFTALFEKYGIRNGDAVRFEEDYIDALSEQYVLAPGALAVVQALSKQYRLYIVTNGVARSQYRRLSASGLTEYMQDIFISEEIGSQKPQKAFFDACFLRMGVGEAARKRVMIVGDSLTSDIKGGRDAGLVTCWYHADERVRDIDVVPDYEIRALDELLCLLLPSEKGE